MKFDKNQSDRISLGEFAQRVILFIPRFPRFMRAIIQIGMIGKKSEVTLADLIAQQARRFSTQTAIRDSIRSLTYKELDEESDRYASMLIACGISPNEIIVVQMENRVELLIILTALSKCGAVTALLSPSIRGSLRESYLQTLSSRRMILGDECAVLVQSNELTSFRTTGQIYSIPDPMNPELQSPFPQLAPRKGEHFQREIRTPASLLCLIFTSGTTGDSPKPARITNWRFILGGIWYGNGVLQLTTKDTLFSPFPLSHVLSLLVGWSSALRSGATFAMSRRFSVHSYASEVQFFNATAGIYLGEMLTYLAARGVVNAEIPTLKQLIGNGVRSENYSTIIKQFKLKQLIELYGATESPSVCTNLLGLERSVGFSMDESVLVQTDSEDLILRNSDGFGIRTTQFGRGVLLFRLNTSTSFDGYEQKEESDTKIERNLFVKGDSWFHCGDLLQDIGFGHYRFITRLGENYRFKGENIIPSMIESEILSIRTITSVVVTGVVLPSGETVGLAIITVNEFFSLSNFSTAISRQLPGYSIPRFLRITQCLHSTESAKPMRKRYKQEGINPSNISDPLYLFNPDIDSFELFTLEKLKTFYEGVLIR